MKTVLTFRKPTLGLMHPRIWPRILPVSQAKVREAELLDLSAFRGCFQPYLESLIAEKTRECEQHAPSPELRFICDYPRRLAVAGGKRLRPYAAYLMFRALGGQGDERALKLLVSLELFHLFCLVHDDIIDNGTQRHGLPTVQRAIAMRLDKNNPDGERIANAQALLLGDMIFAWAQEAFHSNRDFDAATLSAARRPFSRMIDEVVLGEMMDVDMMAREVTTFAAIHQKMLLKTASYTFIRPLQIGAALSGAVGRRPETEAFCHDFGLAVGLAFQIQDDLLDLTGMPQATQKTLFSDLREGQHTYFTQYVFECGTAAQREQLSEWMGADIQPEDHTDILALFEASGALLQGRADIARYLQRAQELLYSSPIPRRHYPAFENLLSRLNNRCS